MRVRIANVPAILLLSAVSAGLFGSCQHAEPGYSPPAELRAIRPVPSEVDPATRELTVNEAVRRSGEDLGAIAMLKRAELHLRENRYGMASEAYEASLRLMGTHPALAPYRERARAGAGEALYAWARSLMRMHAYADAEVKARLAHRYGHPRAGRLAAMARRRIRAADP